MEPARIRIKQAFRGLLSKEAFSKISVAEICREAKLSRVTFYLWYDGKDTLLNDCFQDIVNEGMHYFSQFRNDSSGQIASPLTLTETASFLAGGLGIMIREDLKSGLPSQAVHEHASAMLDHVLSTGLFISDC